MSSVRGRLESDGFETWLMDLAPSWTLALFWASALFRFSERGGVSPLVLGRKPSLEEPGG